MEGPLNNLERANRTILTFWISLGLHVVALIVSFMHASEIQDLDDIAAQETSTSFTLGMVALVILIVYIIGIVLFIQWFRRAYHNLQRAGIHTEFTEGWAAGAWFVPILNLFRPYAIMSEIWEKTQVGNTIEPKTILGWWWAAWIIGNIVDNISFRMEMSGSYNMSVTVGTIGYILSVVGLYLVIQVIKKVSSFEDDFLRGRRQMDINEHLVE